MRLCVTEKLTLENILLGGGTTKLALYSLSSADGKRHMTPPPGPRSPNPVDMHVGARIRLRRKLLKMSQEKLGDLLGVTFQQVQKYERGTNRVGASRLWKISQVLEVPITYLYEGLSIEHGGSHESEALVSASPDQSPLVYEFINSTDGVSLATAVLQIKNKAVRRQILELARSLAASQENDEE